MYDLNLFEKMMHSCRLCGRDCGIDRSRGELGACRMPDYPIVARASLHEWEEPCLSGTRGSGTVFFSGCSLNCRFCQNEPISRGRVGKAVDVDRLAQIYLELQERGAHNINLVTPTHFILPILQSLSSAKNNGLFIPIVYNTASYESEEALELLGGSVDIFLADAKYYSPALSKKLSSAENYFDVCRRAVNKMFSLVGSPKISADGLMEKGIIIRVLLLPGELDDAEKIIETLYGDFGDDVFFSLMSQYTPTPAVAQDPLLSRRVSAEEYSELLAYAEDLGIAYGFTQEGEAAAESFIPAFDLRGV